MRHSSFQDFMTREKISCGTYLPASESLLFADSVFDPSQNQRISRVVLRHIPTCTDRLILEGTGPMPSPDRSCFAFLRPAPGGPQLCISTMEGEVRELTHFSAPVLDPRWSPDGNWLVFTSPAADDGAAGPAPAYMPSMGNDWNHALDPVATEDFGYKFDGLGFKRPRVMHLFVVPADGSGEARRISSGSCHFLHACFAPDNAHVICESNLYCNKENSIAMDVLSIDIHTGEIVRLTQDLLVVSYPNPVRPVCTPDGRSLIVGVLDMPETAAREVAYPPCTLCRLSLESHELTPISRQTEDCFDTVQLAYNAETGAGLEKVVVSSDKKSVLFCAGYLGVGTVYRVSLEGARNRPVRLTDAEFCYNGLAPAGDGWVLAARSATDTPEQYVLLHESTGEVRLLYQSNADDLAETALSRASAFSTPVLDGEGTVHGWCLPPQEMQQGRQYPCIVYVHGGPHPFYSNSFDMEMQAFAGEGFGILFCNPRGSSGYGDRHRQVFHAYDGSAYTDILLFVREAAKQFSWIDEKRLGLTGRSYGGYVTNYAATRSTLFKAYITQRPTVNRLISYASSDMRRSSRDYPSYGEFMDHELEHSEIMRMQKVSAPFLILHGMDDLRCPVEGARQLFVALRDSHAPDFPVRMILYPHTAHQQPQEPRQLQHYYSAMLEWFRTYL